MAKKGFRKGKSAEDYLSDISKEEIDLLKKQREFDTIEPGSFEYKVALYCDTLRLNIRRIKMDIEKRLWNVRNTKNVINRLKVQMATGKITEVLKDGMTMNQEELSADIQYKEWFCKGEVLEIPQVLGQLRKYVGHMDVARNVVMSIEEYNEYVGEVLSELDKLGFRPIS